MNDQNNKKNFSVMGMSCAACVSRVEKAVNALEGIKSCNVSLLTNSMSVTGTIDSKKIIDAVKKAGYDAYEKDASSSSTSLSSINNSNAHTTTDDDDLSKSIDTEISSLKKRLFFSIPLLCVLMYLSMISSMFNLSVPFGLKENLMAMGLTQFLLALLIMTINKKFFTNGLKSLFHLSPTMDSLVALGSGVSLIYSVAMLYGLSAAIMQGDLSNQIYYFKNFYFEGAATIVTLITVGKFLEAKSKGKTTNALKSLLNLAPKKALILKDGQEIEIEVAQVQIGDIFIVKPGMSVPVDGTVLKGSSSIDESSLTGESVPVDKVQGSNVFAGTINTFGVIECKATKRSNETTLSKIIELVKEASTTKAPIARIADKVSSIFVPLVILIAIITMIIWIVLGKEMGFALSRAICVLVVSCPCALGLATPVSIMVANGKGAKNGILFKTSLAIENTGKIKIVAVDKTGTLTTGKMQVCSIEEWGSVVASNAVELSRLPRPSAPLQDSSSLATPQAVFPSLTQVALDLENNSEHPLAKSIVEYCTNQNLKPNAVKDFKAISGKGVSCTEESTNTKLIGGNLNFILENCTVSQQEKSALETKIKEHALQGQTPLIFAANEKILGLIYLQDKIKDDSKQAILSLKKMGIKVAMITGDNKTTAEAVAKTCDIDNVVAQVLPDEKASAIKTLMQQGKTAMVGDGINDALSLTTADIGIAISSGTDVAIDSADIVLMNNSLTDVSHAIKLSRKTIKNIKQNLFWAFAYNVCLIPIAAGAYYKFGITMNPMLGALAMSLSSFCVVTNALRLNLLKLKQKNGKVKQQKKEKPMIKTIKVEGMMCPNCERHVKTALEKLANITTATPNHTTGEVTLELTSEIPTDKIAQAVEEAGYKVIG